MKILASIPTDVDTLVKEEFFKLIKEKRVTVYTCLSCYKKFFVFASKKDKALFDIKSIAELEKNTCNRTCPECFSYMYEAWEIDTSQIKSMISGGPAFT